MNLNLYNKDILGGIMDEFETNNEPQEENLADDEYIEEEADVEDIANSNRTMINAMIDLLIQKGVITEEEIMNRASSGDLPDYDIDLGEDEEEDVDDDDEVEEETESAFEDKI